ncbi:MAG: molybdopterin molybdenumtransferase MoeA [Candidatus Lokiarchaeota archaeon]|nr:molybdopterin molybdenumtransferase MoeA [Candidatus Lokiarchaeota archaeon]MBD3338891.1 molybdopterin molybdenumtransferase MoeA [Candidatus Lokiarchaeota archaeon]
MKFLKTIKVDEFKEILNQVSKLELGKEDISLQDSFHRVAATDIKSNIDVPHFRKSRMDGYAVIASDSFGADEDNYIPLQLVDSIQAGDIPKKELSSGECAYVATGAAIPENANAVVMVEFSEKEEDTIYIQQAVTPGTHVVGIGLDVKKGETIVKKNTLIELTTIGILSSCGINELEVYKKPSVCLFSTGNELVNLREKDLPLGKIYDVNSEVLRQAILNTGASVSYLGIARDNYEELKEKIQEGLSKSDIVILSGGTSKGEGDLGPQVLEELQGIEMMVHGVRIKPGKPIIFAKFDKKVIFILPGYPTSALSCFYVFIENFLRKMSGYPLKEKFSREYEVGERIYSTVGRNHFVTVQIREVDGINKIYPIKTGSEAISTMFYADGYIEVDELESIVEKGDKRQVYSF